METSATPVSSLLSNQTLEQYLDAMAAKRQEHQIKQKPESQQPTPLLRDDIPLHMTSYANDKETIEVADTLEAFFGGSEPVPQVLEPGTSLLSFSDQEGSENDQNVLEISPDRFAREVPPATGYAILSYRSARDAESQLAKLWDGTRAQDHSSKSSPDFGEESDKGPIRIEQDVLQEVLPLDAFTLFPRLPPKLRKVIWRHARPEARYIRLFKSTCKHCRMESITPVPSMLHTCQESRAIALTWYRLSFSADGICGSHYAMEQNKHNPLTKLEKSGKVYFDWERDGIYSRCIDCVGRPWACEHTPWSSEWNRVKRLAFEGPMSLPPFYKILKFFPNVEHIILIGGRSLVPRSCVLKSEFVPRSWMFPWQRPGMDLLQSCLENVLAFDVKLASRMKVRRVRRMILPDVMELQVPCVLDNLAGINSMSDERWWSCW